MYNFYNPNYYYPNNGMADALNQAKMPYQQNMPKPANDIIWTQGEAAAKAYLVAPNNTVVLWDTERPTIYVKSADFSGIPTMRILDFKERGEKTEEHKCNCGEKFVTKEQFEEFKTKVEGIINKQEVENNA